MNAMEKRYTFELVLNLDNKYYTTNLMAGYGRTPDNAMDNLKAKLNNQFMMLKEDNYNFTIGSIKLITL
jgi:hypothetical protein